MNTFKVAVIIATLLFFAGCESSDGGIYGSGQSGDDGGIVGTGYVDNSKVEDFIKGSIDPDVSDGSDLVIVPPLLDGVDTAFPRFSSNNNGQTDWLKQDGQYLYRIKQQFDFNVAVIGGDFLPLEDGGGQTDNLWSIWKGEPPTSTLQVFEVKGYWGGGAELFNIELEADLNPQKIELLGDDRLVVIAEHKVLVFKRVYPLQSLVLLTEIQFDSRIVDSALQGNHLHIINQYEPDITGLIRGEKLDDAAIEANRELIKEVDIATLLPKAYVAGKEHALADGNNCTIPEVADLNVMPAFNIITTLNIYQPAEISSQCLASPLADIELAEDNVYMTYPLVSGSKIHRFSLNATAAVYNGAIEVEQHILLTRKLWLNEYGGYLRVIGMVAGQYQLDVYRLDGSAMVKVATLPNEQKPEPIGITGMLEAVYYYGDRAYIVTDKNENKANTEDQDIDPVSVLDLAVATAPMHLGSLSLSNASEYIQPIKDNWLLAVSKEKQGTCQNTLKLSLFNTNDVAMPLEISTLMPGNGCSYTPIAYDNHALHLLTDTEGDVRMLLPVGSYADAMHSQALELLSVEFGADATSANLLRNKTINASAGGNYHAGTRGVLIDGIVYYLHADRLYQ